MSLASLAKKIENMTTTGTNAAGTHDSASTTTPTTNVHNSKSSVTSSNGSNISTAKGTASAGGGGGGDKNKIASNQTVKKMSDYLEIDNDDLEIFERCGRGAYGSVYRGLWKSRNKIVAIKKLLQLEDEVMNAY